MAFGSIPTYRCWILRACTCPLWFFCDKSILAGEENPLEVKREGSLEVVTMSSWRFAVNGRQGGGNPDRKKGGGSGVRLRTSHVPEPVSKRQDCRSEAIAGHLALNYFKRTWSLVDLAPYLPVRCACADCQNTLQRGVMGKEGEGRGEGRDP